ncbi:MAG: ornithine cyclodeaminase family protein [Bacteroidota bacterium]
MPNLSTLVLRSSDIEQIIRHHGLHHVMDVLIDKLHHAIQSFDPAKNQIPIRAGFHYHHPRQGLIEWMPIHQLENQIVIKVVGYHPENPDLYSLPTILSTISAYDPQTGHLSALVDGVLLTALRTGASSAVASKYMALPDSETLGLIGCGAQAVTQLHALSRMFSFKQILYFDTDSTTQKSFEARTKMFHLEASMKGATIEDIVREADILCTATSIDVGAGPLFHDIEPQPHLHINAVGSDFPGKIELPLELLRRSVVCPDFLMQAIKEGECQQLKPEEIGPDWVQLIQQQGQYSSLPEGLSVFDSTGWPLEDQIVLEIFVDYAMELGLGQRIEIETNPKDAKNPYHSLTTDTHGVFLA